MDVLPRDVRSLSRLRPVDLQCLSSGRREDLVGYGATERGYGVEFMVLGPVRAIAAGRPLALGERKRRLILGLLALEANHLVALDRMVDLVWSERPEGPPHSARRILQAHLSRLRAAVTVAPPPTTEGRGTVSLDRHGNCYMLSCDPQRVDAHRFRLLVEQAREAPQDKAKASLLRQALGLWHGPALADAATLALRRELCDGLDQARLAALEDRLDVDLRLGLHATLIDELTGLRAKHPERHRLTGQLMLALCRCGRASEALRVYQEARLWFATELGLDPPAELSALHLAVLRGDPALHLPGTPRSSPSPNPPARYAQLPRGVPHFVGRDAAMAELDRLLPGAAHDAPDPPAAPVAVITGGVGVGKTALAIHWANRVADRFTGQLYVNLRGYSGNPSTPIVALSELLGSMGVDPRQIPQTVDVAAARFRSLVSGQRILLILDDARSAEQVRLLLPGGADCLTVVTSRDPLAGLVAGEGAHPLPLDVLTAEAAGALLARLLAGGGVPFAAAALADLAALCEYLPLALRIAAANVVCAANPDLTGYIRSLATGDRLSELEIPGDRERGVAAALTSSYLAVDVPARRLFRLLSVAGDAALAVPAVAALAGTAESTTGRLLGELADARLVDRRRDGRYVMRRLPRFFAQRLLSVEDSVEEPARARRRLVDWYAVVGDRPAR